MMAPCAMFSAALGLMIWLPTSAATQTLLHFHLVGRVDADFGHFGEVSAMAEVERRRPWPVPFGSVVLAPAGFLGDQLEHALHALGIHSGSGEAAAALQRPEPRPEVAVEAC